MKKLIAMLLALALVASFGVTTVFAATPSNKDSATLYGYRIDVADIYEDRYAGYGSFYGEVRDLFQAWSLDRNMPNLSAAEIAAIDASYGAEIDALALANPDAVKQAGVYAAAKGVINPFTATGVSFGERWLAMKDIVAAASADESYWSDKGVDATYWKNFYTKQAAKDAARNADNAAKADALDVYLASERTDLDKAIYNVAKANIDAQRALTNAKAAMADAKADWGTAINTYKSSVNVKVAEAQADYYVAVADAYQEAVAGAIAEIYAILG